MNEFEEFKMIAKKSAETGIPVPAVMALSTMAREAVLAHEFIGKALERNGGFERFDFCLSEGVKHAKAALDASKKFREMSGEEEAR